MGLASIAADRVPRPKEATGYMSGGLVSKAIDILSTSNYAVAGATDALLAGENPIEGAGAGIQSRMSFVDVLKNRKVPGIAAVPLGILADVMVPVVPGAGLVKLAKGAALERVTGVLRNVGKGARPLSEVIEAADHVGGIDVGLDMSKTLLGSKAAQESFAELGSVPAARAAAVEARTGLNGPSRGAKFLFEEFPKGGSQMRQWVDGWQSVHERLLTPLVKHMSENPIFGEAGQKFVAGAARNLNIKKAVLGELKATADDILRDVKKEDWEDFFRINNGLKKYDAAGNVVPFSDHIIDLGKRFRAWDDEIYRAHESLGTRQTIAAHTKILRSFSMEQQQSVPKMMKLLEEGGDLGDLADTDPGRLARILHEQELEIATGGHVVGKLRYKENHASLIMKEEAMRREVARTRAEVEDLLSQQYPDMDALTRKKAAEKILMDRLREPGDIRKGLQHQRAMPVVADPADFEIDPRKYMYKMVSDNADLIAGSKAWGGDHAAWYSVRQELAQMHGLTGLEELGSATPAGYKEASETMDRAFEILQGTYRDRGTPFLRSLDRISDFMFLGPRTILLQPTTLANSGALSGIGNSFMGITEGLTDPTVVRALQRLGVAIPTTWDVADHARGLEKLNAWNPIMTMIGKADRAMRVTSAFAGGLHLAESEMKILDALQAGNRLKAEKIASYLQRSYGVDVSGILKGERFSDRAFTQAIQQAAHVSNFTGDVLALPKAFQGPTGKFFLKFKQYAYQQSAFINRLWTEAWDHHNPTPLLRYAAMFPWIYHHVLRAVNQLKSPERQVDPHEDGKEYIKNMLMIGALGYLGDAAMALTSDSEALGLGLFAGPNASVLLKGKQGLKDLLPWRFDPGTAVESLEPAASKQTRMLWENSQAVP